MHGLDFWAYLPSPGVPVLATLHLPPWWYPGVALWASRPETWLNCVSEVQHGTCHAGPILLAPIENGVPVHRLFPRHARRRFALFLGRICPEKGVHLAITAAERAQMPLLIGGEVFPYEEHKRYFAEEIAPRLGPTVHYLGALPLRARGGS
jgi:glycosyltransferase involved in cell wall biosynthesis